jgi:hypothetical protein
MAEPPFGNFRSAENPDKLAVRAAAFEVISLIILAFFLGISRFRRLYLTAMVLFLLVTACGRAAAERSNAPSSTCGLSDQEAAGLNDYYKRAMFSPVG